jgi:hypothetical protein
MVDGSNKDVGLRTSIAIDLLDNVHISYYNFSQQNLKYATGTSGSWSTTTLDNTGDVGLYTSIAIDSSNYVHISYYDCLSDCDVDNGDLKYASNASGSWVDETVDSYGDVGKHTSIAMDSFDNAHISYYDLDNGDLKYTTNAPVNILTVNVVTEGGGVNPDCSDGCWYDSGTIVILTAEADHGYYFDHWTGCDSSSGNICTMTVDENKNVTATFLQCPAPVRILGDPTEYYLLQEAYDAAEHGDTIQSQALGFNETLFIDDESDKSVTFVGGYDCNYNEPPSGDTILYGDLIISNGTNMIENFSVE